MNDLYVMIDSPKVSTNNLVKKKKQKEKINEVVKNKIFTETNKDNILKKINKLKKNDINKIIKNLNINLNKKKNKQRGSVDTKVNLSGFEKLNFFNSKHKSTQDQLLFKINKKKRVSLFKKSNRGKLNEIDSSSSLGINEKNIKSKKKIYIHRKIHSKNHKGEKKKTVGYFKTKSCTNI